MNKRHNCYNPKHQLLARAVEGAWKARNAAGAIVDKLRADHAPASDIEAAMAHYIECRSTEDRALDELEAAA